ncbi:MAG: ribonuclease J [Oscillospiraceae bacterium]
MIKKPLKGNQEFSFASVSGEKITESVEINENIENTTNTQLNQQTQEKEKQRVVFKPNTNTKESVLKSKNNKELAKTPAQTKDTVVKAMESISKSAPAKLTLKNQNTNTKAAPTQQKQLNTAKTRKNNTKIQKDDAPVLPVKKLQNTTPTQPLVQQKSKSTIKKQTQTKKIKSTNNTSIKIIPLGGLNEIGKNMTLYDCNGDMFIVDCGLAFPDESMLGIDIVLPDFTYAVNNADKIKGIVITHGHEDHIGGLAYFLKQVNLPVYGTKLAIGLIEGKLKEHGILNKAKLNVIKPRDVVKFGCMDVEFVRVNHSIPDAVAIVTHSPAGVIVQTGDFKIDYTPIEGEVADLARFGELGSKGVLALLSDSTNAERPGCTMSERTVGQSFEMLFKRAEEKRIIIATFASNIHRVQQICDYAVKYKRKVAVSGRSMENVVAKAIELGYLKIPKGIIVELEKLKNYKPSQVVIITTGSQGEPLSALSRMSSGDHRQVSVGEGDFIIISATPIPGNEKFVGRVVNELMRLGAEVIYEKMYEVHVSGHACQDELKLMLNLTKPKYFIPVHGEYKHLRKHSDLAVEIGVERKNIVITEIGRVVEISEQAIKNEQTVPSGQVLVDGLGVGDVGSIVLRDRRHLSLDGLIIIVSSIEIATGTIVSGPDIVSRGFVYVREAEELISSLKIVAQNILLDNVRPGNRDWTTIKTTIKDKVSQSVYQKTKRSPMILPIIMEV